MTMDFHKEKFLALLSRSL